jgi:hypothetical protein
MDHNFVLNAMSFPAPDEAQAYELFYSSIKGMLAVGQKEDRVAIYCDDFPNLKNFPISQGYTYADFLITLKAKDEEDLLVALLEIDDKTPMLDHFSDADIEEIASTSFFFPDEGYDKSIDMLAVAWRTNGILLSIPTSQRWQQTEIPFAQYTEGEAPGQPSYLRNIACEVHGQELRRQRGEQQQKSLPALYPNCKFSTDFEAWANSLAQDLKARVSDKLALAYAKNFQGGEPLFKTLNDAGGMRELRFGAVQGGAVRVLFGALADGSFAILTGFVKKSNSEGYSDAITTGTKIWSAFKKTTNQIAKAEQA